MRRCALLLLPLAACHAATPPTTPAAFADGTLNVGGRSFHLHCDGVGAPTVVLEAGRRGAAWVWSDEYPEVAKYTRVCVFDQLGGGYSGPEPTPPRSDAAIADDTWRLLDAAGIPGPYVMAGYGIGDAHARAFAERHAAETAAVVVLGPGILPRESPDRANAALRQAVDIARGRSAPASSHPPTPHPLADDGLVDVAGTKMHVHCAGHGAPTVVFDAGRGGGGWHLSGSLNDIATTTRVCVYDRLGLGLSGPPKLPHTSEAIVAELRTALGALHEAPPYVLVGHSFGGMNVQLFAAEHRDEVVGLVLIDPMNEKAYFDHVAVSTPEERALIVKDLDSFPPDGDFNAWMASCAQMQRARKPFGDLPVVMLVASEPSVVPTWSAQRNAHMQRAWHDAVVEVVATSTNGVVVTAEKTGHMIPYDQPALVTAAVREVVSAARTHSRVDGERVHAANAAPLAAPAW